MIRRYYIALCEQKKGKENKAEISKLEMLLNQEGLSTADYAVAVAAKTTEEETGEPAAAIELRMEELLPARIRHCLARHPQCF